LPPHVPEFPVTAPHRVIAAPRPLGDRPAVVVDSLWPPVTQERLRLLESWGAGVRVVSAFASEAGCSAALAAALSMVADRPLLPGVARHLASVTGLDHLADAVVLRQPADLVVLRRSGPGALVAELLAVAFPSGWSPSLRAGASLSELHAPVADNARLQAAAPALSEALLTKGPFLQHVWGLQPDSRLDRDPLSPTWPPPPDPDGRWWLRVERQTTTPLPELDRALFWIRPTVTPLSELSAAHRSTLAAAVDSMSPAAKAYKGLGGHLLADFRAALAAVSNTDQM
jgi:hypothetical protein